MLPDWTAAWIGRSYRHGGRCPDAMDCWGLVLFVLRTRFGVEVPDYGADTPADDSDHAGMAQLALQGAADGWCKVAARPSLRDPFPWPCAQEQGGDVVLMRRGLFPCHVGIVVAPDWMLHAQPGAGVTADRLRHGNEKNNIVALYRHPELI